MMIKIIVTVEGNEPLWFLNNAKSRLLRKKVKKLSGIRNFPSLPSICTTFKPLLKTHLPEITLFIDSF